MNIMTLDGYKAKIEYDEEIDAFRGEILGLTGGADFYGKTTEELRIEFKKSLQIYLEVCKEKSVTPHHTFSDQLNLCISPELYAQLAITAQAESKSMNMLVQEALAMRITL